MYGIARWAEESPGSKATDTGGRSERGSQATQIPYGVTCLRSWVELGIRGNVFIFDGLNKAGEHSGEESGGVVSYSEPTGGPSGTDAHFNSRTQDLRRHEVRCIDARGSNKQVGA